MMGAVGETIKNRAATTADCARLFNYLITDYIPGLHVELRPQFDKLGDPLVVAMVCDQSSVVNEEGSSLSVWAIRHYRSEIYLISHSQLFDLLIEAHQVIEQYFSTGVDNRPSSMKG